MFFLLAFLFAHFAHGANDCLTSDSDGIYYTERNGSSCIIYFEPDAVHANDISISSYSPKYTMLGSLSVADNEMEYAPACDQVVLVAYRDYALLRFDISDIPPDSVIEEATLLLHPSRSMYDSYVDLYPMKVWWASGREELASGKALVSGANWEYSDATRAMDWGGTVPGVHHDSSPASTIGVKKGSKEGYVSFDVAPLVRQWANGSRKNYGVVLKCRGAGSSKCAISFDSSGQRPPVVPEQGPFSIDTAAAMFACQKCTGGKTAGIGLPSPSYKPLEPGRMPPILMIRYQSVPLSVSVNGLPPAVFENEKRQFFVELKNTGGNAIPGGKLFVTGAADGSLIGEYDVGTIAPGESSSIAVGPVDFSKLAGNGIAVEAKLSGAYGKASSGVFIAPALTMQNALYALGAVLALAMISFLAIFSANTALSSRTTRKGDMVCPLCRHKGKGGTCNVCGSSY
jgi:hypothetical protein